MTSIILLFNINIIYKENRNFMKIRIVKELRFRLRIFIPDIFIFQNALDNEQLFENIEIQSRDKYLETGLYTCQPRDPLHMRFIGNRSPTCC